MLEKAKHYNSMQEEVEDARKIIKKLKTKLKSATNELKDIH
jgi:cell division septum initiation protein DivIVA